MEINKVSIIGLGALGIMYSNYIASKMPEANLRIIADEGRIQKYKEQGIYCNGQPCHFNYLTPEEEDPADFIIFSVKFGQLQEAIKSAVKQVGNNSIIISALNGIISEEYLAEAFGKEKVLLCTVQGMDAVKEGNQMVYHNLGNISIGTWDGHPSPNLKAVLDFFDRVELPYHCPVDMQRQLWNKLLCNVGVNQAVTVYETNYGGLKTEGEPREVMLKAMQEVISVAQVKKISLTNEDIANWLKIINSLDSEGKPSMRQDMEAHRPTEVELFAGTIIRLGEQYGIPTPVNEMLYHRIKDMEASVI